MATGYTCERCGGKLLEFVRPNVLFQPGRNPNAPLEGAITIRVHVEVCDHCGHVMQRVSDEVLRQMKRDKLLR